VGDTAALDFAAVGAAFDELEREGAAALADEGVDRDAVRLRRTADVRYRDQVWELPIDVSDVDLLAAGARAAVQERFHARHQEVFDFSQPGHTVELISITSTVIGASPPLARVADTTATPALELADAPTRQVRFTRGRPSQAAPVLAGAAIPDGTVLDGPLIVEEPNTTVVVPPGWSLRLDRTRDAYLLLDGSERADAG
jgi:N-methylhydantoinase A